MFDKQLMRKNIIKILCVIAVIYAIMFIRYTLSRYQSTGTSSIDAPLAFWIVSDSLQEGETVIGEIAPGEEKEVSFTVSNYNGTIGAQVPMEYSVIIEATTNMPLEYQLYKKVPKVDENGDEIIDEDGNVVIEIEELDTNEFIFVNEDGTYYKIIETKGLEFGYVADEDDEGEIVNFGLNAYFPDEEVGNLAWDEELKENWQYSDLIEHIKITIDAKQILNNGANENTVDDETDTQ